MFLLSMCVICTYLLRFWVCESSTNQRFW